MIPVHLMREQNTREILVDCDLDVWIAFVIRKHCIVVRTVFFDQITFQHMIYSNHAMWLTIFSILGERLYPD